MSEGDPTIAFLFLFLLTLFLTLSLALFLTILLLHRLSNIPAISKAVMDGKMMMMLSGVLMATKRGVRIRVGVRGRVRVVWTDTAAAMNPGPITGTTAA